MMRRFHQRVALIRAVDGGPSRLPRNSQVESFVHHPRSCRLIVVCAAAFVLACMGTIRAADALSIEQLVAQKSKWPSFASSGLPMKIEGRYLIFSSKLLRFMKCEDLNFVWHEEEQPFPIDPATLRSRSIEVYGRFALQSEKPIFRVEGVRERPSDAESLNTRKLGIIDAPAAAWYALGDWALERGTFYSDFDLQTEARHLYAEGIKRELATLNDGALDAKIALSHKYEKYGLSDQDRIALLHQAFCERWLAIKQKNLPSADYEGLSDVLSTNLRGCRTPIDRRSAALVERYRKDPIALYREATTATRLRLNRILYTDIRYAYLQAFAKQKNQDGLQFADAIDREVPELHDKAEKLREQTLDERLAAAATMSRSDVLRLAERFTQRGEPDKALQAKKTWVMAADERRRKEGRPDDLIEAAHEHQTLLEDDDGAAKLLIEAYEISPGMKTISEQLDRLGWIRAGGKWLTRAQAAALPPDPSKQAAAEGNLVGMTREQVQKAMASRPDSVTRVISAGQLNEVWIYNQQAGSRFSIHFLGNVDGHDLRAVKLVQ
jgi:hypothetical protein